MKGTIVVVATGYRPGPWVCRSLRAAGWRVVGVQPDGSGSGRSTACVAPRRVPSPVTAPDEFVAALRALCAQTAAGAVIALDEDCVRLLADRAVELAPVRLIGPTAAQYRVLCDKGDLAHTARAAGVDHPASVIVTPQGPAGPWPSLPSVVKTRGSASPVRGIDSVVRVATAPERDAAVALLLAAGLEAVVQEWVDAEHWTVHCVRAADGGFRAVTGRIVRTYPRDAGMPSIFDVVGAGGAAVDATRRLLDAVDYRGPANAQFFARDGRLLVHDVNLRPPAPVALSMWAGLDLPALGVAGGLGLPLGPSGPVRAGWRYVSLVDELRAIWHRANGGTGDGAAGRPAHEIARALLSRGARVDPPLRDPLWVSAEVASHAARTARRIIRGARPAGVRPPASP